MVETGSEVGSESNKVTTRSPSPLRESSINVSVRVRPFTTVEENNLIRIDNDQVFLGDGSLSNFVVPDTPSKKSVYMPKGIRKIINVVDDRMLIFDPPETNPLTKMHKNAFPNAAPNSRIREHRFVFDKLFDVESSQHDVFLNTTRPLLNSILDGFNATVFAYGATGCGKTHTILGPSLDPGIIFLTMKELYQKIEEIKDHKSIDVSLSFLEIYNETIKDLLNPQTNSKKLVIREDANQRINVSNLSSHKPQSVDEVMDLIVVGNKNRTSSPTEANATSSRSHAVLQINVMQKNRTADITEEHTFATLSIIDLAGSERAAATKNRGLRLNEGANINKSLLALGNCINALCDPRKRNHIPYRDSKLTRLLKFSLGGNCQTVMIVCVSPLSQHYDETLNTLKYADRAKEIKTKITRNQHNLDRHVGSYLKMITEQKQEIEELKTRELRVVQQATDKQKSLIDQCLDSILEHVERLQFSLLKQHHDRWRKYFVLAKRKILLVQKLDFENLLSYLNQLESDDVNLNDVMNLCEQLLSKLSSQIKDLELQYSIPNEIDFILNDSARHVHLKLKENHEYWSDIHSQVFESYLNSIRESLEKDFLFNSSILFDHLIFELSKYNFFPKQMVNLLQNSLRMPHSMDNGNIIMAIKESIKFMVNGDFDTFLEEQSSLFMQRKLKEQEFYDQNSYRQKGNNNPQSTSNTILMPKNRDKRGSSSPLKSSPPRTTKKSISKKPLPVKFSPTKLRGNKKVHWDVPNGSLVNDSDLSFDESNLTGVKSDFDDDSPLQNNVLDSLDDDLDIKYDTSMNSPPVSKTTTTLMSKDLKSSGKTNKPRRISLTNRKLLAHDQNDSSTKLPRLNKQASTKIINSMTNGDFDYLSTPQSPNKIKFNAFDSPSSLINLYHFNNEGTRNIESNGSDKVD